MSGINVLSDSLQSGSKIDKTSKGKGSSATDSLETGTVEFAAMLSDLTSINADPIGQKYSNMGEDLEEGQNQTGFSQNPGYGQFALSFLSQPVDMSNLPAGKEANSGNGVNQGMGKGLLEDNHLWMDASSKLSLDSNEVFAANGMTSLMLQGKNPGMTELDKYRQIIADLLIALDGQIKDLTPKGESSISDRGTSERLEMMKLIQGWLTVTEDEVENVRAANQAASGQSSFHFDAQGEYRAIPEEVDFKGGYDEAGTKIVDSKIVNPFNKGAVTDSFLEGSTLGLEEVNNLTKSDAQIINGYNVEDEVSLQTKDLSTRKGSAVDFQQIIKTVQDWIQGTDNTAAKGELNSGIQKALKPLIDLLTIEQGTRNQELHTKASTLLTVLNRIMTEVQERNDQGVPKEIFQEKNYSLKTSTTQPNSLSHALETAASPVTGGGDIIYPTDLKQKIADEDLLHTKPSVNVNSQNLNPNAGVGFDGKIVTGNVADGKTTSIPVWEQISNVVREQVSNRNQELKELDIQLHPAELGRIRIGLRWENGQVHLQMHTSEAATAQILQNQLPELRNTLTNQGVSCGMLQMGQQGGDHRQQNQQGNQFRKTQDSYTHQIEDEEQFPLVNSLSQGDLNHRINVTA